MSSTTLIDVHRRLASELQNLRRRKLGVFESWLDTAIGRNLTSARKEILERILLVRK
jgi:hypothetical protein